MTEDTTRTETFDDAADDNTVPALRFEAVPDLVKVDPLEADTAFFAKRNRWISPRCSTSPRPSSGQAIAIMRRLLYRTLTMQPLARTTKLALWCLLATKLLARTPQELRAPSLLALSLQCTWKNPTCVRVVPAYTGTFRTYTRGRVEWTHGVSQRFTHHAPHTPHTHTHTPPSHHNNTTTTPHGDRQRGRERRQRKKTETGDRDRDRDRDRERREDSGCARVFSLLNRVKHYCSLILSVHLGRSTVFNFCELFILCRTVFHFYSFKLFTYAVKYSNFPNYPNYLVLQLQFFFAGNNSA